MIRRNCADTAAGAKRSVLATRHACEPRQLRFAGFTLDLDNFSLAQGERPVILRRQSFDVLRYLTENPGRLVMKAELMSKVWPGTSVTDDSLVQCIKNIRTAMGDTDHQIIRTVPRRGYLFTPAVTRANVEPAPASLAVKVRYAKSGDVHIAYQTWGEGSFDLVFVMGFVGHVESLWSEPSVAAFLRDMGRFARVVVFDKRGTGMSDRTDNMPGMDERVDDLRAVMDALHIERAALVGASEGGSLAAYFAATHPHRCRGLVLYGAFAQFSGWIATDQAFQDFISYIDNSWGSGRSLPSFAPSMVGNSGFEAWWGRFERLGASPAGAIALMRCNRQIDISTILSSIRVPTLVIHRTGDQVVKVEAGRLLAAGIPGARLVTLPGADHLPWVGENSGEILRLIGDFLETQEAVQMPERVLATVLVMQYLETPTGSSTALSETFQTTVRRELGRCLGREVRTVGDATFAMFDGPSRAIAAALAVHTVLQAHGAQVRTCVHVGEVERSTEEVRGRAVDVASGGLEHASIGDVLVSRTVKDLVSEGNVRFDYVGTHKLPRVVDAWALYRVRAER